MIYRDVSADATRRWRMNSLLFSFTISPLPSLSVSGSPSHSSNPRVPFLSPEPGMSETLCYLSTIPFSFSSCLIGISLGPDRYGYSMRHTVCQGTSAVCLVRSLFFFFQSVPFYSLSLLLSFPPTPSAWGVLGIFAPVSPAGAQLRRVGTLNSGGQSLMPRRLQISNTFYPTFLPKCREFFASIPPPPPPSPLSFNQNLCQTFIRRFQFAILSWWFRVSGLVVFWNLLFLFYGQVSWN